MIRDMVVRIAAHLLEASEADLEIVDGAVSVRGTPARALPIADIARTAWFAPSSLPDGMRPGLEATCDFRVPEAAWSQATHCCFVEVDVETGRDRRSCATSSSRTAARSSIPRSSTARSGAGSRRASRPCSTSATSTTTTASSSPPPSSTTCVPAACDLPDIEIDHLHPEPLPAGEVPFRGVGEGGFIGAPGAVTNAVADALAPLGVQVNEQYLPPLRVRQLIEQATR